MYTLTHKQFNSSSTCPPTREYRMIDRGPGFLVVVKFGYFFTFLPPSPVTYSSSTCDTQAEKERQLIDRRRGGGRGRGRSQIIRWRENLVLYKSFNTLCPSPSDFLISWHTYIAIGGLSWTTFPLGGGGGVSISCRRKPPILLQRRHIETPDFV